MKCKICGSDQIVEENGQFVCRSCGCVFFEAPSDDADEMIKEAKEAIEAKEAEAKQKQEEEQKAAEEAEAALRAEEARKAEEALKAAESEAEAANHAEETPEADEAEVEETAEAKEEIPEEEAEETAEEESAEEASEEPEAEAEPEEKVQEAVEEETDVEETAEEEAVEEETTEEPKIFAPDEPLYEAEKMADEPVAVEEITAEPESEETEEADEKPAKKKKSAMREVLDFCFPIIIALVVAMLLKTFVFANAQVPTGSMLNTIQEGDRIIASRLEYNFHDVERFDIIIFKFPDDVAMHKQDPSHKVEYFVKRVIGLPGETVTIVNGTVYVTDKNGKSQQLKDDFVTACTPSGNFGPYEVPENSYFVMGDNRESSIDSRYWKTTNYVNKNLIIGKVKFRYYPSIGKIE